MAGGRVRIIAGRWRGRRLAVEDEPDVRPTPDRVRETLFNWLAPQLPGARCLDLFAGSGALGFEAVSRGAAEAVLIDRSRAVGDRLRGECDRLEVAGTVTVVEADALDWLAHPPAAAAPAAASSPPSSSSPSPSPSSPASPASAAFDIVFVDPPQRLEVHREVAARLAEHGWLAPAARVWFEVVRRREPPPLPCGWTLLKSGRAGDVRYYLASCD